MRAVIRKELGQYFHTVIGYLFLAVYIFINGYFFVVQNLMNRSGDITDYFRNVIPVLIFLTPVLTMRSFAEEKRQKTDILMFTKPITIRQVVLGKFFAVMLMFLIGLAATLAFPVILAACGSSQAWITIGNYAGILLLTGAFAAIGIFVSAMTENQIVAAAMSYVVIFAMWYSYGFGSTIQNQAALAILNRISIMNVYYEMILGVFNPAGTLMLLTIIAVFLFLTVYSLERKRG